MGHLMISEDYAAPHRKDIPDWVRRFAYNKANNKYVKATDFSRRARFYILKQGMQPSWTYNVNDDRGNSARITLHYSQLDTFDPFPRKSPPGGFRNR
jgi:hypothetical protein